MNGRSGNSLSNSTSSIRACIRGEIVDVQASKGIGSNPPEEVSTPKSKGGRPHGAMSAGVARIAIGICLVRRRSMRAEPLSQMLKSLRYTYK
jgi:hypothetical protein